MIQNLLEVVETCKALRGSRRENFAGKVVKPDANVLRRCFSVVAFFASGAGRPSWVGWKSRKESKIFCRKQNTISHRKYHNKKCGFCGRFLLFIFCWETQFIKKTLITVRSKRLVSYLVAMETAVTLCNSEVGYRLSGEPWYKWIDRAITSKTFEKSEIWEICRKRATAKAWNVI